jgi:ABC-type dipeptide/oligopeptide/nickel transport system permease subunit
VPVEGVGRALREVHRVLFAGGLLVVSVLAVNFIGDGLRDALDPNSRGGRRRQKSSHKKKAASR